MPRMNTTTRSRTCARCSWNTLCPPTLCCTPPTLTTALGNATFTDCRERRLALTPPPHVRFLSRRTQNGQDHHNDSTSLCVEDILDHSAINVLTSVADVTPADSVARTCFTATIEPHPVYPNNEMTLKYKRNPQHTYTKQPDHPMTRTSHNTFTHTNTLPFPSRMV
ncbi:hypothetical protein E2C01_004836 [Portunus trituberculatus]|uniref:Uncharacterized protein n=1 Tax=Portunus trituberculatus TaxID=210409 RepID=A0A5B7CSQ4_PORTR|nr:hypothetical protein [Portunus trituberculatus]